MGNIAIEQKNNKFVVKNRLVQPETINERELEIVVGRKAGGLLPITTETSKKGIIMKSAFENMTSLKTYFNGIVSKKMFLDIVVQIVSILKECEKNLMNVNNLMLDLEYIFLTPRTKTVQCIFWPVFNNQSSQDLIGFFKELPFRVVFSKQEEHEYIADYLQYFNSQTTFSINSFEKLILELLGKGVENKAQQQSVPILKQEKVKICSKCGNVGEESAKFCKVCGTPIHVNLTGNEPSKQSSFPGMTPGYAEGTTVLYADRDEQPSFPYLIREKTQEKIDVNKPIFRIGKDSGSCDYSVIDNNAVSRNHANIISKNERYFIIDNRSTNSTYVDGRAIPVQTEVEIFSGTKLRLANESFIFYL